MTEKQFSTPFLNDHETNCDLLNYSSIAETIVKTILANKEKPITIGVHGDWGAGKSSILEMIETAFKENEKVVCLKFNGWSFQGFEDAKISLLEGIVTSLIEKRSLWEKAKTKIVDVFRSIDLLKLAKRAGGLALTYYSGFAGIGLLEAAKNKITDFIAKPEEHLTKEKLGAVAAEIGGLIKAPEETKRVPQELRSFNKAFGDLLEAADVDQLVVLIDDLDRCLPEVAIDTLEAIRLFVNTKKTAFVIGADEEMIENAVKKHFDGFTDSEVGKGWAKNYLEKLIQIPFRIPNLGEMEIKMYVSLLLIGARVGEKEPAFQSLVSMAKGKMRKPWEAKPLDQEEINKLLSEHANKAQDSIVISEQIGPLLARGTRGNPRQIKRFINTLVLRQAIADARGFGNEIKLQVLAKLMLAERLFQKSIFERIANTASTDPHGNCETIAWLEKAVNEKEEKKEEGKEESPPDRKSEDLEKAAIKEWLQEANVLTWARMNPPLSGVDLRPYLFITQTKNAFSATLSLSPQLLTLVDQLRGPTMMVSAKTGEVEALDQASGELVFDAIRSQIIQEDSFSDKPKGIDGMILLVKKKPTLQLKFLTFLEGLPRHKLGVWVIGGWTGVFSGEAEKRFQAIVELWGKEDRLKKFIEAKKSVAKGGK